MMKRNPIVQSLLLICLVIILPALSVAEEDRRDGNWWREEDRPTRSAYITGFFDGMNLGNNFSYWGFIKDKEMNACASKVAESFADYSSKYFKNVTNVQLADGLDSFYTDFRNRSIRVADAIWLVVNRIAGTPQERLDSMIESWRRNTR